MDNLLYAKYRPRIDSQKPVESIMINPENETIKVDAKNMTFESSGLIAWVAVVGFIAISILYIYGKFFHERVRAWNHKRKKTKK